MLNDEDTYLLSYKADSVEHIRIVDRFMMESSLFNDVMVASPLVTLFRSRFEAPEIMKKIDFLFPNGTYFVAGISDRTIEGKMPGEFWLWFHPEDVRRGNALLGLGSGSK